MRFHCPDTLSGAMALLGDGAGNVCLAGGGLVVPALRFGAQPAGLVSLRSIAELRGMSSRDDGAIHISAMTSHAVVARSDLLTGGMALVRRAAREIAHPVIRNMATIGGTVSRADPAADYSCALLAAGALIHLRSMSGERTVAIDDFVLGDGRTVRRDDELITTVSLPGDPARGSSGYVRFSRVDGDYPVTTAGVRLAWRGGAVAEARIAIGGCGPTALRARETEAMICGVGRIEEIRPAAIDAAVAAARPGSDIKGSAAFRRMLIPGLLRRAFAQAFAGAIP